MMESYLRSASFLSLLEEEEEERRRRRKKKEDVGTSDGADAEKEKTGTRSGAPRQRITVGATSACHVRARPADVAATLNVCFSPVLSLFFRPFCSVLKKSTNCFCFLFVHFL
jgi:hypothetical protein